MRNNRNNVQFLSSIALPTSFIVLLIAGALLIPVFSAQAALPQIVPDCNPTLAPNATELDTDGPYARKPPCGINAFLGMINTIIKVIGYLIIPLAAIFIGWGGFDIMLSAGNASKVSEGRKKITIAIWGVVIYFLAFLIVEAIFIALKVPGYADYFDL